MDPKWHKLIEQNRPTSGPLYQQISLSLKTLISSGQLQPGEAIPSEWELHELYGASRLTIRRAMDDLVRAGLLNRRHGVGTFVASSSTAQIVPSELSFTRNMLRLGRTPSSRIVSFAVVEARPEVARHLKLEPGAPVFELVRVRLVDGEPLMLETTYLSQARFPGLLKIDLGDGSLYSYLAQRYQTDVVALDQAMEPTLLTEREALLLHIAVDSPALLSEIVGFTSDGTPIEYTWSVTCGGRGRFYFHFREGAVGMRHFAIDPDSQILRL
jgi:GntR family transcriptional regulator